MANFRVATHATEQQLRLHVIIQCFTQQMYHTKHLLEHRAQENGITHQDVQSSEIFVAFTYFNSTIQTLASSILFMQVLYS